jgi:hypothetical protein
MNKGGDTMYGLGFLGALVYYVQQAKTVQDGVIGVGKAIIWPALLVYKALTLWKL